MKRRDVSAKHVCKNVGCNAKFKWGMQLKRHKEVCTFNKPDARYTKTCDKTYHCNTCHKVFQHQPSVIKHLNKKNCTTEKPVYKCAKCQKTFAHKCRLIQHVKLCKGDVEQFCPNCNKIYTRADHLAKHVKSCHTIPSLSAASNTVSNSNWLNTTSLTADLLQCIEELEDSTTIDTNELNISVFEGTVGGDDANSTGLGIDSYTPTTNVLIDDSLVNDSTTIDTNELNISVFEGTVGGDDANSTGLGIDSYTPTTNVLFDDSLFNDSTTIDTNELNIFAIDGTDDGGDDLLHANSHIHTAINVPVPPVIIVDEDEDIDSENRPPLDTDGNRARYFKDYRYRKRKTKTLESIVNQLNSPVRKKVVTDFMKGTPRVLNEIYAYTDSDNKYEALAISNVISRLKTLSKEKKFGTFYRILDEFFGEQLQDEGFAYWLLNKKLGLRTSRCLPRLAAWRARDFRDPRGRSKLSPEDTQKVFDMYVENSITSTDGRNGRNMLKISKRRLLEIYGYVVNHDDIKIEEKQSRKRLYYQSNRQIFTCTIQDLQQKLKDAGLNLSIGKIHDLKPFFISYPTDKELALCLCKLCLNSRLLLDALLPQAKKDGDEISQSVTEFFTETSTCDKVENGFFKWSCMQQKCKGCKHNKPTPLKCSTSDETTQVSQFQTTKTPYNHVDKKTGVVTVKISEKTERVVSTRSFSDIYQSLAALKRKYLMHRYQVFNDKHHWPKILATTDSLGPIYHIDYSENLTQSYKFEPQSSHFNKKQYSLHCTVKHLANGRVQYIYHFSDAKKHDFAFTSHVVRHLQDIEDESCTSTIIRMKSDNCSSQYKCCYVFDSYQKLAKEKDKTIIVYYGVSGHGKGLVDAMSAFGVKTPLRRAVVTENLHYNSADDLRNYLSEKFLDALDRQYFTIDPTKLDEIRQQRGSFKIKDCQAQHMISYFPDGQIQTKVNICSCDQCLTGKFVKCAIEIGKVVQEGDGDDDSDSDDERDDTEYEDDDYSDAVLADVVARGSCVLDAIAKDNVIALLTDSIAQFFLCKVLDYGVATTDLGDRTTKDFVCEGEQFIACQYFELDHKNKKRRGKIQYKLLEGTVYINPATVFCPNVTMNADHSISTEESQWLCDSN